MSGNDNDEESGDYIKSSFVSCSMPVRPVAARDERRTLGCSGAAMLAALWHWHDQVIGDEIA
jgi:hypothetical protein